MDQDIRFAETADGVRLAYSLAGHGPPLVKAAHWLSHLEHDWRSVIWRPWLQAMAEKWTLVRYDERGCGLSDRDVNGFSFEDWVNDLETVVDAAGLDRFALAGMSQGGPIAIAYAVRHPQRVSHLILYGTYTRGRLKRNLSPRVIEESKTLIKLIELGWGQENPAFAEVFASLFIPDAGLEHRRAFTELQRLSTSPGNAAAIVAGFDTIDVRHLAKRVRAPALVLHSRHDARVPFEEGRRVAALIPNARLVTLDSPNHILQAGETPLRLFIDEASTFLDTAPTTAPETAVVRALLTPREREVLELIAQGLENEAIAQQLTIRPKTVRNHITRIFWKMGVRNRAQAIVRARDAGLGLGGRGTAWGQRPTPPH